MAVSDSIETGEAKKKARFHFSPVDFRFPPLENKDSLELLKKWSMGDSMNVCRFRFDEKFTAYDMSQFVRDFFNDEEVLAGFRVLANVRGTWSSLGHPGKCKSVEIEEVVCEATNMAFFDRFYDCGAVRQNGSIQGCFPEYLDNFTINQEIGKVLLMEDSDHYDIFSAEERKELLFKIFQHLTLGGPLNQYEDEIGPYFETVKSFYKSLVSVGKDPKTKKVVVNSLACKIKKIEGMDQDLFPQGDIDHPQDFCYLIVNPIRREATVWYYAWCGN